MARKEDHNTLGPSSLKNLASQPSALPTPGTSHSEMDEACSTNKLSTITSDSCPGIFQGPSLPGGDVTFDAGAENNSAALSGALGNVPNLALSTPSAPISSPLPGHVDDNGHCYIGLVNQAMTCYLNSLIQTLYMTPEFRNAIYEWKFTGTQSEEARSIPCQLQKLFLLLQTSERESLETRELTKSFGWGAGEAYDQHDVQELCRIMFDALEQKWRKTNNSSLIQNLYRGSMEDFVKCLACGTESTKNDVFLDLPLAIKQFGIIEAYKSVEEALHAFIKPEILDGNNQYFCEKCGKKQDAQKGLRITQFPYLLTIQLKRFDFDYITLHRIKLNDKMTFPYLLNLNEFVYDPSKNTDCEVKRKKISWASVAAGTRKSTGPLFVSSIDYVARAEGQLPHVDEKEVEELLKKDGPYVYELFSVMVHQGSATGGHYYAYIKNMDQDAWFCFNDSSVTAATVDDIRRTYGGSLGGWSSSNTNAYMLMYRRIDKSKNAKFVKTSDLPDHLKSLLERWESGEEEKRKKKEYEESLVRIRILINGRTINDLCGIEKTLKVPYTAKLKDLYEQALSSFIDADSMNVNRFRLIECADAVFTMKRSFSPLELRATALVDLYPKYSRTPKAYRRDAFFILDVSPLQDEFFEVRSPKESCTCKLIPVDVAKKTFLTSVLIQFSLSDLVSEMRRKIGEYFGLSKDLVQKIRLVSERRTVYSMPSFWSIEDENETCGGLAGVIETKVASTNSARRTLINISSGMTSKFIQRFSIGRKLLNIYFDTSSPSDFVEEDRKRPFEKSQFLSLLERKRLGMILTVRLPDKNDYKQAGMVPPHSLITDEILLDSTDSNDVDCTTIGSTVDNCTATLFAPGSDVRPNYGNIYSHVESEALSGVSDAAALPIPSASSATIADFSTSSLTNSLLSSTSSLVSDDEREAMSMELGHSGTSSPLCTPVVSPSISESGDVIDPSVLSAKVKERYERTFNAVADMKRLADNDGFSSVDIGPVSSTAESSEDTVTVGAQTATSTDLVGSSSETSSSYEVVVLSRNLEEGMNEIVVDLDGRQSVSSFKEWISKLLGMDVNRFVVLKHYKKGDDGYESVFYENESVRDYYSSVSYISISLRSPLKENERMIRVSQFETDVLEYEKWPYLFSIVASSDMKVHEILLKCRDMLLSNYSLDYELKRLRLREIDVGLGAPVMNSTDNLGRRSGEWSRNVYLQILSEEETVVWEKCGLTSYPVTVQRWNPSTLEVSARHEIIIPAEIQDQTAVLKEKISEYFQVSAEKIELSELYPSNAWTKYPYTKDRLELLETVCFSSEKIHTSTFNGKLVYFKLVDEMPKRLTEDERRAIRIKDSSAKSSDVSGRRRERPLRIQLSSSVSEDNSLSFS